MRAFVIAALAIAAVSAEAEADAYTIGQVAAGLPLANAIASGRAHNPGYISHISYPASNVYSGYAAGYGAVSPVAAYSAIPSVYGAHYIGKRSADSDAYTLGQVAAGLPVANAYATGHAHNPGYISHVEYPASNVYSGYAAAPAVAAYTGYSGYAAAPALSSYSAIPSVYGAHYIGKRSADSDADAYTLGQVAAGLPVANAYATGHAHNPGYISHVEYPSSNVYSGYAAAPAVAAYTGYSGYAAAPALSSYSAYPSVYGAHYIGKRSADSEADAYTIGQVAAGLPLANAYATGHAHNAGYINHVSYPASNVYSGYAAAPAVAAYTGYSGYAGVAHAGYGYNTLGYTGAYLG